MPEKPSDHASAPPASAGLSVPAEAPEASAAPQSGTDATAALQAENAALQDRVLRALAEADNTRRRAQRDLEDERQFAVTGLARELLPVLDNLRRAIVASEQPASQGASLTDGVRATERLLMGVLQRVGVQQVAALGAPFDPSRHEAMMEVDDPATAPGTVRDVMEDGYVIHDRLLRPARVTVTRRGASRDDHPGHDPLNRHP
ncbi:nucleotide exchange factor GrpE [Methylobacterium sp. J-070]|uniref:nucleotide exchange factor GrpE n=1 Tax=Methylobacterium sp. J-070 TaxID=2836650 RepID=UPI001FB9A84E|nr:nucleotide exchange factor GrpE [Methylobacterium sp. J-070]MCJ2049177.1 nucleotide exchange factor GrpE [Methylobacterium sp. J-070]